MDIILLPLDLIALLAIGIIIGTLVVFIMKKWMITYGIIIANLAVLVLSYLSPQSIIGTTTNIAQHPGLGFRPVYLSAELFPNMYTLGTSMFVHSDIMHFLGNMIIFFFMGIAFEQRIGWKKFLSIYLVTGICGALTHSLLNLAYPDSLITLVGASGAIFGILGAFAFAYPWDEVVMPIPIGIMFITRIKVLYAAILFALVETLIVSLAVADNTAHFAHLGGLVSGIVLAAILIKRKPQEAVSKKSDAVYYVSTPEKKQDPYNYNTLQTLANTPQQEETMKRIKQETVPQVRDVWLDHFLNKTVCPKCGTPLHHLEHRIWCEACDFRTSY